MKTEKIKSSSDNLELEIAHIEPNSEIKGVVQISHGMAEHKERYYDFMEYLKDNGYAAVIHDHRGHGASVKSKEDLGYFYTDNIDYIINDLYDVTKYIKKKYNIIIGERTAEDLKVNIGCVFPKIQDTEMEIRGRDLGTGLPSTLKVRSSEMLEALIEPAMMIVEAVHSVLERTPPELAADISDKGIYMTGGGCLVDGLDKLLQEKTGINVMIAQDTVSCVALGTGKALDNLDALEGKARR